ncbi:MAG: TrmH family RNA methyltransferase [Oscillospiraceae bacterium]|nr:TrmH family RNA methyltransferase [Oscillospiraceae bacterium]
MNFKTYKKEGEYSYALGASVAIELLRTNPKDCLGVILSPNYTDKEGIIEGLCEAHNIPIEQNQKLLGILSPKENCFVAAAFAKRRHVLDKNKTHVVLDQPSDMGNLGACMRSCAGFRVYDLAVIGAGADAYNPKAIRASMGAFFHVRVQYFESIRGYLDIYQNNREIYTFMLKADHVLQGLAADKNEVRSLIFGNEASGLDYGTYKDIGKSVVIAHSDKIDSLALPAAVSIALFSMSPPR